MTSTANLDSLNTKHSVTAIRMCQQDIIKHDLHVKAYIQDIRDCGANSEVLSTLNMQISENMRAMRKAIEELERIAYEQDLESDKKDVLQEVGKYRKQMSSNQGALRKANIACQNLIDQNVKEELFSNADDKPRLRIRADKDSIARQSTSVTESLVALNSMMAMNVKQSEETLQTLIRSSSNITDTGEELKTMGSVIGQSRKLLHKYGRREVTDKVLIALAVMFFFTCIFYVVQKRLF